MSGRMSLGEAIDAHKIAVANVEAAAKAVESAKGFVKHFERELEGFADVENAVAAERAKAVMSASLGAGGIPSFALSPALHDVVAKRAECEANLSASRQAAAALSTKATEAADAERIAKSHAEALAGAVVADELADVAAEVKRLEFEATVLRMKLHGAAYCWGSLMSRRTPVKLPKIAEETLIAPSPRERIEARGTEQALSNAKAARWQKYLRELATDASAIFEPEFMG